MAMTRCNRAMTGECKLNVCAHFKLHTPVVLVEVGDTCKKGPCTHVGKPAWCKPIRRTK